MLRILVYTSPFPYPQFHTSKHECFFAPKFYLTRTVCLSTTRKFLFILCPGNQYHFIASLGYYTFFFTLAFISWWKYYDTKTAVEQCNRGEREVGEASEQEQLTSLAWLILDSCSENFIDEAQRDLLMLELHFNDVANELREAWPASLQAVLMMAQGDASVVWGEQSRNWPSYAYPSSHLSHNILWFPMFKTLT